MTKLNKYQQEIESLLTKADKATDKALYGLYVDTIKYLKKALFVDWQRLGELSTSEQLKLSRMTALLDALEQSTADLKRGLKNEITGHLVATGNMAYNELFYETESKHGSINFAMLKEEELKTIIETPVANYKLSERLEGGKGVAESLRRNIKDDLTRVFLEGVSYQQASARLAELGYSSYRRALNITRTEAGRVQAVAREKSQQYAKSLGIEFDKVWVATLDGRTRHNHAMLDGKKPDEDGYFEINGLRTKQPHMFGIAGEDVNCRCRTISRLEGDDSSLPRRDNETGEIVEYKNYREWYSDKKASEGMNRRWSDVNKPPEYNIRPRLSAVRAKAREYGLDLKEIKIKINRNEMAKVIGMFGSAPSEELGTIYLYLNAFADDETLIRTLLHEKEHIRQYKKYGADHVMNNTAYFEEKARKAEEMWYNLIKNKERK